MDDDHYDDYDMGPDGGHPDDHWPEEDFFFQEVNENTLTCSVIISIAGIAGLVGNALMVRAWMKYPKLRNDFYTVFTALSLVDILFIVMTVPATIGEIMEVQEIHNSASFCKASKYLSYASGFISAYLIAALAALRAILLTNRNMIPRPRAKHMIGVTVVMYILVFVVSIPIISMYTSHGAYCYLDSSIKDNYRQVWLLDSFSAFVPLLLVFIFYLISFILGKRYFADSYSPRERQKSRLVSCVVLAFIICQLPYRIVSIYEAYLVTKVEDDEMWTVITVKDYFTCLLVAGKAVRPILCSKLTKDVGHAFDEIINCQNCQKQTTRANGSIAQTPSLQPELLPGADTPIPPPTDAADFDPIFDPEPPSPLTHTPSRRIGVDRTISTSSTTSSNSQAPLIRHSSSSPSEIEMM